MPINTNIGGVLHELSTLTTNVGGVLHEFDVMNTNDSGVLKTIYQTFSSKLSWVDGDAGVLNSTAQNGFFVSASSTDTSTHSSSLYEDQAAVTNVPVKLKSGDVISFSCRSGNGSSGASTYGARFIIYNSSKIKTDELWPSTITYGMEMTGSITIKSDGLYYFGINGHVMYGSQSGVSYYNSTVTFTISITRST